MNSKVTWGLAWLGLALIIAVPSADFLTNNMGTSAAVVTSTTDPVQTGAVTTTRTATGIIITPAGTPVTDPVDKLLKTGKTLPDYITDDSGTSTKAPTQVAAIDTTPTVTPAPVLVAPTPFPSWARPHAVAAAPAPVTTTTANVAPTQPTVVVDNNGVATVAPSEEPLIIDEPARPTAVATTGPVPPADIPEGNSNWDDQSLTNYLSQQGLLDDGDRSTATVTETNTNDATQAAQASGDYDPDGFYMSDGPNSDDRAARRRARLQQLFGDDYVDDGSQGDTADFNLF